MHPARLRFTAGLGALALVSALHGCAGDHSASRGVLDQEGDGVVAPSTDGSLATTTDPATGQPGGAGDASSGGAGDVGPTPQPDGSAASGGAQAVPEGPPPVVDFCGTGSEALVAGLSISEVAIYQAVKIPLMASGSAVGQRSAPVVQGREALLRVFVQIPSDWSAMEVAGTLVVDNPGMPEARQQTTVNVSRNSTDGTLSTTFNFDIPAEQMGPETGYRVILEDPSCSRLGGTPGQSSFPASESAGFGAEPTGSLEVVLVPVEYSGGGTKPAPTQQHLDRTAEMLGAYYPVTDVTVTVHPTGMPWSNDVASNGGGWSQLLEAVMSLRQQDRPANDVYYFALVQPGNSFQQYCGFFGCVAGIAPQNDTSSFFGGGNGGGGTALAQVGLGVGFMNDEFTYETMIHELAHAHGRGHAQCDLPPGDDGDLSYPYSNGDTGVWGFDRRDRSLHSPSEKDMMGYCMPIWISDYTYDALATRISEVSLSPYIVSGATTRWRLLHRDSDGGLRWGQTHEIDGHPPGRETSLGVLNQQGEKIREIPAYAMAIPELDGELLWVPEPEVDWKGLLNEGRWIDLDQVRPALQFELPAPAIDRALPTAVRP